MQVILRSLCVLLIWAGSAVAQSPVWVQIEAQPTLTAAQDRVRAYAAQLEDVAGFYLGSGWYGIVLGPYAPDDAERLLRQLRRDRQIPGDSFIAFGRNFRQQFWPVGIAAETAAQPLPDTGGDATGAVADAPEPAPEPLPVTVPDETPRQARASEALLTRPEKELLQIALKWSGEYQGAIDGAYGRGTRRAMEAWQVANNHEATGVLTTAQRQELLAAYNAVLDGMDLQLVRDDATGIEMQIPLGVVTFDAYEPPFARFGPSGDLPVQVLLISQPGDQTRMAGLYEILQTLAIVPPEGGRERKSQSFTIVGRDDEIVSTTRVWLRGGLIKGFMLVWPAGDDERRKRVEQEMSASFTAVDGVLDPALVPPDEDQAIDLIAGLAIRKPQYSRSGFFVDDTGTVLTTIDAVQSCERITIDTDHDADVVLRDADRGIAVLRPQRPLAPIAVAAFQTAIPRLQSDVAVAGYPFGGVLVTPSLTFGTLADLRGLEGQENISRLALASQPGDAGGPVFDNGGAVLGMLLPRADANGRVLPADVSFAVETDDILTVLSDAGVTPQTTSSLAFMPPETLSLRAADQTVLVSCW